MPRVKIVYSSLEQAIKNAQDVARGMEQYAEDLPRAIVNPLSSLSGGSSGNTSTVISLANRKASDLRSRATDYRTMGTTIETFITEAREADRAVGANLTAMADKRAENLPWWKRLGYEVYKMCNGILGNTQLGAFLDNLDNYCDAISDFIDNKIKDAFNWFRYGDGKYLLNMGIAIAGLIGSIAGFVLSFPASGVFAALMAVLSGVGLVVTALNTAVTLSENAKALALNDTEPGRARYYGSTSTIEDYAKKNTTKRGLQNLASVVTTIGQAADIASSVGGTFLKTADDGAKTFVTSFDDVMDNLLGNIGLKKADDGIGGLKAGGNANSSKYELHPGFIFGDPRDMHSDKRQNISWLRNAESIKYFAGGVGNFGSVCSGLVDGIQFSDIKLLSDIFPGVELFGYIS